MLYNFSITPLREDNFEGRCAEIVELVKTNAITMPLFNMNLVPEGNPVMDKATNMAKTYARYRDVLARDGVKCGILVQSSLGHGHNRIPNPFQTYIRLIDGKESQVCCPEDEEFIKHFCGVLKTLAKENPEVIMLDDDFRLMMRPGRGCACPLHMKEFNSRAGLSMTREELYEYIKTHDEDDPITDIFRDTQRDSLIKAATAFREAIDSINPSIQGANCTAGHICESVMYTNKIFAGKGNPTIVRSADGSYAPFSVREFTPGMRSTAVCFAKLKKYGIDVVISETDTIPFNRYGKSAAYLHADYTSKILEGAQGAKHWITRISAYEPDSCKAYRQILAKNYGFYEKLTQYAREIKWVGCAQAFSEQEKFYFNREKLWKPHSYSWTSKVLERMGIPFYFSENGGDAVFLEGDITADMKDEQIAKALEGSVFADGDAVMELTRRGFADRLGVIAEEWDLGMVSFESFDVANSTNCTKQNNLKKIIPTKDGVEAVSYNCLRKAGENEILAPAVTKYKRADGRISVAYCGSPDAPFTFTQGFAFLNESRKAQFVSLLKEAKALPIYCHGDDEICFRAGYVADGRLLATVIKLGIDVMDSLTLYLEKEPTSICLLDGDGNEQAVEFTSLGDNLYEIKQRVETMYPLVLLVK